MFNVHLQNTTLAVHSTATEQIAPPASLLLYPNPANNQLFVQLPTNSHIQKIQISNYLGDLLFEGYPNANTTAIDLTQLPKGMYLVTVQNEQERYTHTFVKQ